MTTIWVIHKYLWLYVFRNASGEEVSVSLLYSRIKDRLNTPHPCVQEKKHHAKKEEVGS